MSSAIIRGRLIALEGGEGCGKSTQAELLSSRLGALLTREPGGTAVGQRIRGLVLDPALGDLDARAEALLVAADRAQHVAQVIRPAIATGRHVVTDRFSGSTLAYQGFGRGLDLVELKRLSDWASYGLEPDLVFLLDVAPEVAAARMGADGLDRFESQGGEFHEKVAEGYQTLAASQPLRWVVVDGSGSQAEVADRMWAECRARLELAPSPPPGGHSMSA